ncbi:MAG: hypothetical protein AAFR61_12825 [Bacteroidota bacterium]
MGKFMIILALISFSFFQVQAEGVTDQNEAVTEVSIDQEPVNVIVHFSPAKVGKNGRKAAKITKIVMGRGQQVGNNAFRAKLRRKDNLLHFEIQMKSSKFDRLIMPEGFIINDRISKLLGSQQVVMSGGSTMVKQTEKNMLWFEIQ